MYTHKCVRTFVMQLNASYIKDKYVIKKRYTQYGCANQEHF